IFTVSLIFNIFLLLHKIFAWLPLPLLVFSTNSLGNSLKLISFGSLYTPYKGINISFNPLEETNSLTLYRSEEHTSELQSRFDLVCRLLLEKKNKTLH